MSGYALTQISIPPFRCCSARSLPRGRRTPARSFPRGRRTPMACTPPAWSSSMPQSRRKRPDLPLITCTECGRHKILEFEVKKEDKGNRGRIFYKCPARKNDGSGCSFWYWEEQYVQILNNIAQEKAGKGEAVLVKEEKKMKNIALGNDELLEGIRALVCIGKEIVGLLRCILFVCACALSLAGYVFVKK